MYEWRMIERYNLLDRDEFVIVWDDLGGIMSLAFERIAAEVEALTAPCVRLRFVMRGWMGVNEYPHQVGVLAKIGNPPPWLSKLDERPRRRCATGLTGRPLRWRYWFTMKTPSSSLAGPG